MAEKTFVLHDGEDEDETAKLHTFLGDLFWEGDESGIVIYARVEVRTGDTIVIDEGDGTEEPVVSVRRAAK